MRSFAVKRPSFRRETIVVAPNSILLMKLRRETVLTPFGIKTNYHLPDTPANEWLITEAGKLRYHLRVPDNDPAAAAIQDWMDGDTLTFDEVLAQINRKTGARLAEHTAWWGIALKQDWVEIELEKLPRHFVVSSS
jgi:hypothetical protein